MALGEILGKDTALLEDLLNEPLYLKGADSNKKEVDLLKAELSRTKWDLEQLKRFHQVKIEFILQEVSWKLYQQDQTISALLSSQPDLSGVSKAIRLE